MTDLFWKKEGWEASDPHLTRLAAMPFQRPWPFIPEKSGLYIIRGPRQIGKTSWLKAILAHHAGDASCFYMSCEEIVDYRDLGQMLRSFRFLKLIILDEISFVAGWDRAVKHFMDSGYDGILCLSGSHAYDLEKGIDLMPGRFGAGGEFHLLPMTFAEFSAARRQAGWSQTDRTAEILAYFRSGGFPTAVAAAGPSGKPPKSILATYLRWLKGDVKRLGKDPEKLIEVLIQISRTLQTPVSYNTLAKKTSIGSTHTVIEYVRLLEASFALRTLHAIDLDTGAPKYRSDKKFYFTDPLIYWIAVDLAQDHPPADANEALAELVAMEHLSRRYQRFGFFRNDRGEIDFIAAGKWCVEVKWSEVASHLSKTFHSVMLPQKIVWTHSNFLLEWPEAEL